MTDDRLTRETIQALRALANPRRLQIMEWLRDPETNFPPQRDGDLVRDGVCVVYIADKLGVAQPSATQHLQALATAGLITPTPIGRWKFYRRNEEAIAEFKAQISKSL